MTPTRPDRPRFSVVSACYDVGAYLPDFIASIEAQDFDLSRVEVIMVDDGSGDDTPGLLAAWAERRPGLVRVVTQPNRGQGAARNHGTTLATGEWITFTDPDDVVDPDYLTTVDAFLREHPDVHLVATKRLLWRESTGELTDDHPLTRLFSHDRCVDLDVAESSFHGSAPAAFFDLDRLRRDGVEFDGRIRPNFEDGHFTSAYLLHQERPLVGFVASARYHYRKRADASSTLQGSMRDPGRFTDVFEYGYLAIVELAERLRGHVPMWLQHFLVYEVVNYLRSYDHAFVATIDTGPVADAFHDNMARLLARIDADRVVDRAEFPLLEHLRRVLQHGYSDQPWHQEYAYADLHDKGSRLARIRYLFTGDLPDEHVDNGEVDAGPRHAKIRDLEYFGRVLIRERILWVRLRPDLRLRLDGVGVPILVDRPATPATRTLPPRIRNHTGRPSRFHRRLVARLSPTPGSPEGKRAARRAGTRRARRRYAGAWVLMDRIHDAGDSGEILFRHLRTEHPEINAWFVIEKDTTDWARLRTEFGNRVIAHGTVEWRVLMAHCVHLISSHADEAIALPAAVREFTRPGWRFVFLQHGVIKDDLSSWLAGKRIDLFVTSTQGEHASIAGNGNRYPFTTKEVQLTGLPRFDRLCEIGDRFPPADRDLVLLAPTWRNWLVAFTETGSQRHELSADILDSDFVRHWRDLLTSPDLHQHCTRHGATLALLPHPNLAALTDALDLPDHVVRLSYDGADVQEYFARSRVLVTDYSSVAFNAAYLDRPVVYYQFDADRVLTGDHVGRAGYFDYHRHGFGPVTTTPHDTTTAIAAALDAGPTPAPPYDTRITTTFPHRDRNNSARVTDAILAMTRPDTTPGQVPTPENPTRDRQADR